ncbi:arginine--tRNA ligase [Candidatus Sulfidibacterium hydrothermale]|uniref:arginine--tRNA ligase n=1 Tax=Candidatus Sulfidibacterium hydrothermale TaxID=2875962 RepID=UPI001F0A9EE7|nr:arginine--tRNA ligase [Candidatus Sulfidibacterium hydrothermale]UBM61574.1 arginine--tRNA ligase [Candidatus Sulfidibacterium hydrothermale]
MLEKKLAEALAQTVKTLYGQEIAPENFQIQKTRPEFDGDLTVVVFPLLRYSHKAPEATAEELGSRLVSEMDEITGFNVIKGFLNLDVSDRYWLQFFEEASSSERFGFQPENDEPPVVIEYSSPNTNKPLHLGHVRNNLLGWSVAEILKANGRKVYKVNLVNDRGIHICKSMLAWQKWGNGKTPENTGIKGDKLVGDFYVLFDKEYKKQIAELVAAGMDEKEAAQKAPLIQEAKAMLVKWESGDPEVRRLWEEMNRWVYTGFDVTYKRMGVDFDKIYYESDTYLLGKALVQDGLEKGIFYRKEDGSVWCDLRDEGLDEKLLLRADGTSVYMTQDLGTAQLRYDDYHPQTLMYVVGNEQNYHFEVLQKILKKLGKSWADGIYHLSYGMVELPHGKMKSREGTVVDADDLMEEMAATAKKTSETLGKFDDFTEEESRQLWEMIGMGALKYFILKVDPKKTMLFNPEESIDFNGNTGSFIQYTHARIRSVIRKAKASGISPKEVDKNLELAKKEKSLLQMLYDFPQTVKAAAKAYSPAQIANYSYELAKEYNQFYHDYSILKEENAAKRDFRVLLSDFTSQVLRSAMGLLGIQLPERM